MLLLADETQQPSTDDRRLPSLSPSPHDRYDREGMFLLKVTKDIETIMSKLIV